MTTISTWVFFIIIDCHFVIMNPLCIGLYLVFVVCFFFFFFCCAYLCSHLFCIFVQWVPIFDFYLHGFPFLFFVLFLNPNLNFFLQLYFLFAPFPIFFPPGFSCFWNLFSRHPPPPTQFLFFNFLNFSSIPTYYPTLSPTTYSPIYLD